MSRGTAPVAASPVTASTALAVVAACCLLLAACGTRHRPASFSPVPAPRLPVTTAVTTSGASWAVVRTGGRPAGGTFWQLLVRPAHAAGWRLVTPPGVADNAGLVLAPGAGGAMTVGFVPSALLRFTPLATTTDDGAHWSQGLLPARLAALPGALAALPGGRLLAITASGALESGAGGTHWKALVTLRALAASAAGRACGLTALTAVAAGPSGAPVLGGSCGRAGTTGLFLRAASGWYLAPAARHSGRTTTVLRMARTTGRGTAVLIASGPGRHLSVAVLRPSVPLAVSQQPVTACPDLTATFLDAADGWGGVVASGVAVYGSPVLGSPGNGGDFHATGRAALARRQRRAGRWLDGADRVRAFGQLDRGLVAGQAWRLAENPGHRDPGAVTPQPPVMA